MNFFINQAMGLGNSGVEHAEFYRAERFKQAKLPFRFLFLNLVPELHRAMDRWGLHDSEVLNLWEYLVLGESYLKKGLVHRTKPQKNVMITDNTNTNRKQEFVTDSGMRVIQHFYKGPDKQHPDNPVLQVGISRVELYLERTGERKVMYQVENDTHRGSNVVNIHLFNERGRHLFFRNLYGLHRYFFEKVDRAYHGNSNFIIDRGEFADDVLMQNRIPNSKIVYIVHADQLANRDDPKYPLWNDHYEYMLEHLHQVDRVVTATKLQRDDLLIDDPSARDIVTAIPVGGVRDGITQQSGRKAHRPFRLITASRLAAEKHVDIAIKAVANLHNQGLKINFDIYGQGEEQEKLEKTIKEQHAEEYVHLKGLSHDLENIYPNYDAFVSTSFSEGFGLTYIEALNAGLPVVTFDARFGAQELIQNGVNGYLVNLKRTDDDYNVEQIQVALHKLITGNYSKLQAATSKSVAEFQDQITADKWRKLINGLRTSK
ncbi:glycosyltransferase [Fructilactobacillus cliffordii]|uniref:Glycosyltransferase n=1 Tax=Fructilactobacillus cliffordii TaxID=2940299 RepID=A0A9Q8ZNH1_9LACO|nr:glycosyltransferase [Fructilactobacillus cliffordii]USS86917.1 glycosyltransferase [Fructilactobacillus cliffordii]USS88645.1 glycosyltransferase [Fructilactobacillus cliffordii]